MSNFEPAPFESYPPPTCLFTVPGRLRRGPAFPLENLSLKGVLVKRARWMEDQERGGACEQPLWLLLFHRD